VGENARERYRIEYPLRERPRLEIGAESYPVIDCSESGLRFEVTRGHPPELGATVRGAIRFRSGREALILGTVVRVGEAAVAVQFVGAGVPMGVIMREQLELLARYPKHMRSRQSPE
jgi:hypothetical protein